MILPLSLCAGALLSCTNQNKDTPPTNDTPLTVGDFVIVLIAVPDSTEAKHEILAQGIYDLTKDVMKKTS